MESLVTETSPPSARQRIRTSLLVLPYALAFFIVIAQVLTFVAGTWVIRGSDGSKSLALSSLSIIKFDGIVSSPSDPDSYLVTMHQFAASFGYEYPSASTAGIVGPSPHLPYDFTTIGKQLSVPSSEWACYSSSSPCTSPFFAAFRTGYFMLPTTLTYVSLAYSLLLVSFIALAEVLIAVRPSWLRCQCYFSCLKRVCPCPRGSRAEIEALPPGFWDRYRVWAWFTLPCAAFLPAFVLSLNGMMLKTFVDRPRAGNVDARFGTGFVVVQASCMGAAFAAAILVYARKALGRKMNWMEQQGVEVPK